MEQGLVMIYDYSTAESSRLDSEDLENVVDIIAVHGLGAHRDYAWLRKEDGQTKIEEGVNWLKDLLPETLRTSTPSLRARIFCFNYDSRWLGQHLSKKSLGDIADRLVNAVHISRLQVCTSSDDPVLADPFEDTRLRDRPLIFIGHSFGGLVIEKFVLQASLAGGKYHYLVDLIAGIILLGTPHRGSGAQTIGDVIAKAAQAVSLGETSLISKIDEKEIYDVVNDFTKVAIRRDLAQSIICFFETQRTDYGRRTGNVFHVEFLVVDKLSATIFGLESLALDSDHFKLNKFRSANEENYCCVSSNIHVIAASSFKLVKARLNPRKLLQDNTAVTDEIDLRCMQALFQGISDPVHDRETLRNLKGDSVPDTCDWILTDENFVGWLTTRKADLLWLSGGPGKGKTMISMFITEELTNRITTSQESALVYFFCDNKDQNRRRIVPMLRGLIVQLLRQLPRHFTHIRPQFQERGDGLWTGSDALQALWSLFERMLSDALNGPIHCVIDGLDECEDESVSRFIKMLRRFMEGSAKGVVKVMLVSRGTPPHIQRCLSGSRRIDLDSMVVGERMSNSVEHFISFRVHELFEGYHSTYPNLREALMQKQPQVQEILVQRAERTYLWVSLLCEELKKLQHLDEELGKVDELLESLPAGVEEIYGRILRQIPQVDKEEARKIICWVVTALRPLTLSELASAIRMPASRFRTADSVLKDKIKCCEPLLKIEEDKVNLLHQSVKEYLTRKDRDEDSVLEFYRADPPKANLELGLTLLTDIQNSAFSARSLTVNDIDSAESTYPLLGYATRHWPDHYRAAPASAFDLSQRFFSETSQCRENWFRNYRRMIYQYINHDWDNFTLLHIASYLGISGLIEKILAEERSRKKNLPFWGALKKKTGQGATALHLAAIREHLSVAQLLLDHGADLEERDGEGYTPLYRGILHGKIDIVKLFLTRGAKISNFSRKLEYQGIHLAVKSGNAAMVKMLLDRGLGIDEQTSVFGKTPLMIAVRPLSVSLDIAKLLLERGANTEIRNGDQGTALHIAARSRASEACRMLLESGADKEARDRFGQTPLFISARTGWTEGSRLLLENGADVNAKKRNVTPLAAALEEIKYWPKASNYHIEEWFRDEARRLEETINLLREYGAEE